MNKRDVVLEINEKDVTFVVDLQSHNMLVNGVNAANKVQPSHNFLMACCEPESKDYLRGLLTGDAGGALAVTLANMIDAEYTPQVNIIVKKPVSTQT